MTPNLKRLFDRAVDDLDANEKLSDLFTEHGEALIEALEDLAIEVNKLKCTGPYHFEGNDVQMSESLSKCHRLLVQLEQEAQP